MAYPALIDRALAAAAIAHQHQLRKNPLRQIPYVAHCAAVGALLLRAGFGDEVVAAGILHDAAEDTDLTLAQIADAFGQRVADLVSDVTEHDKSLSWEVRKRDYLEHLQSADIDALAIAAADKLHNNRALLDVLDELAALGLPPDAAWAAFKRGPASSVAFTRRACDIIKAQDHRDPRLKTLCDDLDASVSLLEAHIAA